MSDILLSDPIQAGSRAFGRAKGAAGARPASPRPGFRLSRTGLLRIIVLIFALGCGYGAFRLAGNLQEVQPAGAALLVAPAPNETEDVLVAGSALPLGKIVTPDDLVWLAWPKKLIAEQSINRNALPGARDEMIGSLVRIPLLKGEPVRAEKLVRASGSGILAAMLPSGYRAVAITIDSQGSTTAGGFILPGDHVDVIRTLTRPDPKNQNEGRIESETLLTNVRVLAIGQNIQERNGERVITGANATLEVAPVQAELLAQAQRLGQISLSLRSMADAGDTPATLPRTALSVQGGQGGHVMTVGVMRAGKRQEYSVPGLAP